MFESTAISCSDPVDLSQFIKLHHNPSSRQPEPPQPLVSSVGVNKSHNEERLVRRIGHLKRALCFCLFLILLFGVVISAVVYGTKSCRWNGEEYSDEFKIIADLQNNFSEVNNAFINRVFQRLTTTMQRIDADRSASADLKLFSRHKTREVKEIVGIHCVEVEKLAETQVRQAVQLNGDLKTAEFIMIFFIAWMCFLCATFCCALMKIN